MKVLIAIDLAGDAEGVVARAAEWVERLGAVADVAYVVEYTSAYPYIADPTVRNVLASEWTRIRDAERERAEALLNSLPAACRGTVRIPEGPPAQTIANLGESYDAVMVGTHGRTGVGRVLLGSVAEKIVRLSTVPVLVIRQPPQEASGD